MWFLIARFDMTIITINHQLVKQFPHREQAVVWCYEHGLVLRCRSGESLANGVRIYTDIEDLK